MASAEFSATGRAFSPLHLVAGSSPASVHSRYRIWLRSLISPTPRGCSSHRETLEYSFGSGVRFSGSGAAHRVRPQNQFSRESVVGARNGSRPLLRRRRASGGGWVGTGGAGGPVSLPRDSNTRRIKPTGNQTFQYPCSCRIYAIKRPPTPLASLFLPTSSLHLSLSFVFFLSHILSCRPPNADSASTGCSLLTRPRWTRCSRRAQEEGGCRAAPPPANLIPFNIIDVRMCRAI